MFCHAKIAKKNLADHMKTNPLTNKALSSRAELMKWGIDLHNSVNQHIGKPVLSYDSAMKNLVETFTAESESVNTSNYTSYGLYILIIIIVILLMWALLRFVKR